MIAITLRQNILMSGVLLLAAVAARGAGDWNLVFEERFDDAGWTQRWEVKGDAGETDKGALLGREHELIATLGRTFTAPAVRVEYDAAMVALAPSGRCSDLSVFIGDVFFQFGGEENSRCAVAYKGKSGSIDAIATTGASLIQDGWRKHHVVAELNGRQCVLTVDGVQAAIGVLDKPLTGELAIKLYSWTGTSRFDNIKVFTREHADEVNPQLAEQIRRRRTAEHAERRRHDRPDSVIGELRYAPTIHSMGFEWDIEGDNNHNATCTVRYRRHGESAWNDALPLLRIDYRGWFDNKQRQAFRHFNMLAGSIMFLAPGSQYEVELKVHDPDGGEAGKTLAITTRAEPVLGAAGRTLHVAPDGSSVVAGDGSADRPFIGLATAALAARPGDLFLLHAGKYKGATIQSSGEEGRFIAFKPAGDGEVVFNSHIGVNANHLWFQGFTFVSDSEKEFGGIRGKGHGHDDIVVVRNTFKNCRYALSNTDKEWNGDPAVLNHRWYVADNVCDGGPWTEYFTRLYLVADSDICYNRVTTTQNGKGGDGIALRFSRNIDAYGNDLHDINDDLFEPDSSYANIRIWRNRGVNPMYQAVSFQPQLSSPWYIVQNEFVLMWKSRIATPFKPNVFDRNVIVNNTFVVKGRYGQARADILLRGISRNNLWVHLYDNPHQKTNLGGAIWQTEGDASKDDRYVIHGQTLPDWKSDVDYNGFAWDDVPDMQHPGPFWWARKYYKTLEDLVQAIGIEQHSIRLDRDGMFDLSDLEAYAVEPWSSRRLKLRPDSHAVDAGAPLANLAIDYEGHAPDLGAYEHGRTPWHVGPRP